MPFPVGWPPRPQRSSTRSLRFFVDGVATVDFSDRAYLFIDGTGANPYSPTPVVAPGSSTPVDLGSQPLGTGTAAVDANLSQTDPTKQALPKAAIWSHSIRVCNDGGGTLEITFDGTNVQDKVLAGTEITYRHRHESGIAVRGNGVSFRIAAW